MTSLWPWLAVAGIGALHGLNPFGGWVWAAASGVHSSDRNQAWRALLPIALGHLVSVGLVAVAVSVALPLGFAMDGLPMQIAAAGLLSMSVMHCLRGKTAARTGLAFGSFIVGSAQGAGLMLVPALIPLCFGEGAVRQITASGSMTLALAAVALHAAAMLAVTALMSLAACRCMAWLSTSASDTSRCRVRRA